MPKNEHSGRTLISIAPEGGGIVLTWKFLLPFAIVLLGGGSVCGYWTLSPTGTIERGNIAEQIGAVVEQSIGKQVEANTGAIEQNAHAIESNSQIIGEVRFSLEAIASTQQRQVARDEARRVTEDIRDRARREREFDRLYEKNIARLSRGVDPCGTTTCSD